jgi:SsrA-binding protein
MSTKPDPSHVTLASNRKARHEYLVLETLVAGIALRGTEVKSIREGKIQLREAWVSISDGEAWLNGAHVSHYSMGNRENHELERPRKLLLRRRQIDHLAGAVQGKGLSIVPLEVFLAGRRVKVEIALVKGKKLYDKRQAEREKTLEKEARDAMRREID